MTIWGSSGCKSISSLLTDSTLALWSVVNWTASIDPVFVFFLPRTARESPRFATKRVWCDIIPTRQHDPTVAICGLVLHSWDTTSWNPSSAAKKALLMVSSATTPLVSAVLAAPIKIHEHILKNCQSKSINRAWVQPSKTAQRQYQEHAAINIFRQPFEFSIRLNSPKNTQNWPWFAFLRFARKLENHVTFVSFLPWLRASYHINYAFVHKIHT